MERCQYRKYGGILGKHCKWMTCGSSSSSVVSAGQRFLPHRCTLEVRPGRISQMSITMVSEKRMILLLRGVSVFGCCMAVV